MVVLSNPFRTFSLNYATDKNPVTIDGVMHDSDTFEAVKYYRCILDKANTVGVTSVKHLDDDTLWRYAQLLSICRRNGTLPLLERLMMRLNR